MAAALGASRARVVAERRSRLDEHDAAVAVRAGSADEVVLFEAVEHG